jgi:hypothetical protein
MFGASLSMAFERQGTTSDPASVKLNSRGTDLEAHSVGYIAENGATLQSRVIVVAGRVRSVSSSPSKWAANGSSVSGPDHDVALESPNHQSVVFGLAAGRLRQGSLVYFPAVVVAVGHTKQGSATSYVVAVGPATNRPAKSGTIGDLLRAYVTSGRRPH